MAIRLSKTLDTGVQAEYWRIMSCTIDRDAQTISVLVSPYVDETMRRDGKVPIANAGMEVKNVTDLADLERLNRADFYDIENPLSSEEVAAELERLKQAEIAKYVEVVETNQTGTNQVQRLYEFVMSDPFFEGGVAV